MSRYSARRLALVGTFVAALAAGANTLACRTTTEDVHRWANTKQGPRKLVAVLTHQKFPIDLRVEAAMTLVAMKPRAGRRVGIEQMIEAFNEMPEAERSEIISRMIPLLASEIRRPPTGTAEARVDASVAYKDAAVAMLTNDRGPLVSPGAQADTLKLALEEWVTTDFSGRMDDSSQKYGVEQVLRYLGPSGVRRLPALIIPDAPKIDRIAALIAELGDKKTKVEAGKRLVAVARQVSSDRWRASKAPKVAAANKVSKLEPTKDQFQKQLEQYQEEELLRTLASMKKVGQRPVVEYLLEFAGDKSQPEKRRATALAALEGHIDKNNQHQVERVLELAGAADTPDTVRDVALRRLGEMPRKLVVEQLYSLFDSENWKIRWVAAELVLKMSNQSQIGEFMGRLGKVKGLAITEPLRYGKLIANLKGKSKPDELMRKYIDPERPAPVRLSALGYYYEYGETADLDTLKAQVGDKMKVPGCLPDAKDCEWKCAVQSGATQTLEEIETVGEFVEFCIVPAVERRGAANAQKPKPGRISK